jgi:hypothetical protein
MPHPEPASIQGFSYVVVYLMLCLLNQIVVAIVTNCKYSRNHANIEDADF